MVGIRVMGEKNTPNGVPTDDPRNCQLPAAPRLTLRLRGRCRQTLYLEGQRSPLRVGREPVGVRRRSIYGI